MDLKKYPNVTLLNHPLLKHKISILRDEKTPTSDFLDDSTEFAGRSLFIT